MRLYTLVALSLVTLTSCESTVQKKINHIGLTEEQKRKYYMDSVYYSDSDFYLRTRTLVLFDTFMDQQYPDLKARNKYDDLIYALEEPYIDTAKLGTREHWFRITVKPCFRTPYSFTVEKNDGKSILTTKITNGRGGYYAGILIATTRFLFGDTLYNSITDRLNHLNFWELSIDSTCSGGFDGETWTFEAIENRKYNIIKRWVPQFCGNNNTLQLAKIGVKLGALSKINDILKALGAPTTGLENGVGELAKQ